MHDAGRSISRQMYKRTRRSGSFTAHVGASMQYPDNSDDDASNVEQRTLKTRNFIDLRSPPRAARSPSPVPLMRSSLFTTTDVQQARFPYMPSCSPSPIMRSSLVTMTDAPQARFPYIPSCSPVPVTRSSLVTTTDVPQAHFPYMPSCSPSPPASEGPQATLIQDVLHAYNELINTPSRDNIDAGKKSMQVFTCVTSVLFCVLQLVFYVYYVLTQCFYVFIHRHCKIGVRRQLW